MSLDFAALWEHGFPGSCVATELIHPSTWGRGRRWGQMAFWTGTKQILKPAVLEVSWARATNLNYP